MSTFANCVRSTLSPWESYGPLVNPTPRHVDDLALYSRLARLAGVMIETCGFRERSHTRFRVASAVILEIQAGQDWSLNQRRLACGCHSVDFRQRIAPIYEAVLFAGKQRAD